MEKMENNLIYGVFVNAVEMKLEVVALEGVDDGDGYSYLNDMYETINCRLVDVVRELIYGHDVWVDDEGIFTQKESDVSHLWIYNGRVVWGNGIVLDVDSSGNCQTCSLDESELNDILHNVLFVSIDKKTKTYCMKTAVSQPVYGETSENPGLFAICS